MPMVAKPQYFIFDELVTTGYQTIFTKDINDSNIDVMFDALINILKDGIETEWVQNMMVNVIFEDGEDVELSLFDFLFNVMFWKLRTAINEPITSLYFLFFEDITSREMTEYINNTFLDQYRKSINSIKINRTIDDVIGKFRKLRPFQPYLCNTLNLKDTIDLMNSNKEFYDTLHLDISNIPIEEVKDVGMAVTKRHIEIIKNSWHCLRDSFRTGEGTNTKQYKEVAINVGSKPDGQGGVYSHPIANSFMNGGLTTEEEIAIESSVGRVAQILQKNNVGDSGAFARNLEINNQDTRLHPDPNYICDTKHFQEVNIDSPTKLKMYNLRYYREQPNGVDKLLNYKKDKDLLGKKLYFRSPMTCASAARGEGICYKCYGDLAYTNSEVNIGQIAAEGLSSRFTQILLSAKHLLESLVIKLNWVEGFQDLFRVSFNEIYIIDGFDYKGYKIIINEDDIMSVDDFDETVYNYYINEFTVKAPDGMEYLIRTESGDNIYFTPGFYNVLNGSDRTMDGAIEIDMNAAALKDNSLFVMEIQNNELSRTMNSIINLIDTNKVIQNYDRNGLLEAFTNTNISGGIILNAVHFEILLMNLIRSGDDILELPDWTMEHPNYQIIRLTKSLQENRSIAIRLQHNIKNTLNSPDISRMHVPSIMDVFYMIQPQEYLNPDVISDEYVPESDVDENIVEPIFFENPKVVVGRTVKKRKIPKKVLEQMKAD